MRNFRTAIGVGVVGLVACSGLLAACQSYHFVHITPNSVAANKQPTPIQGVLKPAKIMLVLDKSGSMATNPDNDNWGCCLGGVNGQSMSSSQCNQYDAAGSCKWNTLRDMLLNDLGDSKGSFLDQVGKNARFGLAIFPDLTAGVTGDSCVDGKILVDVGAGDNVDAIKSELNNSSAVFPHGGTPTAHMLQAVVSDSNFVNLEANTPRYVILITDGEPNCNSQLNGSTCNCPIVDCSTNPENCLDDTSTVDQVKTLYATQPDSTGVGIKTFVIGFGADTTVSSGAAEVLNNCAVAGHTDQTGSTKYYSATSAAQLEAILSLIIAQLQPCTFGLDQAPQQASLLEVTLTDSNTTTPFDGQCQTTDDSGECVLQTPGDWNFTDSSMTAVQISGQWCSALQNADPGRYTLNFLDVRVMQ